MPNVLQFQDHQQVEGPPATRALHAKEGQVIFVLQSRSYAMSQLHKAMLMDHSEQLNPMTRSIRVFTQRFCGLVRRTSTFSLEDLKILMNEHSRIQAMRSLPGAPRFLPLTTSFLHDLESDILRIPEYSPYGGGFLGIGAYGVPTQDLAAVIAEICGATRDFQRFQQWCLEYMGADFNEKS